MEQYKERTGKINTRPINDKTRKIYTTFIKNFYKRYTKNELDNNYPLIKVINNKDITDDEEEIIKKDFKFLIDDFENIFKNETNGTIKYLNHIFSRTKFDMFICRYLPYVIFFNKEYQERRKETKQDFIIDFDNHFELLNKIKNANLNYEELILSLLLLFNPVKRLQEYQYAILINKKPTNDDDKKYNYLYENTIYINICKNDKRTKLEKENKEFKNINKLNLEYIEPFLNRNNEFLLGKFIPDNQISIIMKKAMKKIFDVDIGIHELRRIYLSYRDNKGINRDDRQMLSKFMNHDLQEQNNYIYKIDN